MSLDSVSRNPAQCAAYRTILCNVYTAMAKQPELIFNAIACRGKYFADFAEDSRLIT
jgi:hypothetical protein